ncbi:hypothetical protein [Massilia sp. LjRoot122]|uniref:hypothetical protein n=1 Tax=Massilia sp. LjRoot122 TaxID=3342257 RepID=UPI003ED09A56
MRRSFPALFRCIALFLVMTLMTSGIAMASYLCPEIIGKPAPMPMMEGEPCAGMDIERPAHCAEFSADPKASVDQHNPIPALSLPSPASLVRILAPVPALAIILPGPGGLPEPGTDPPYLRTLRIRV